MFILALDQIIQTYDKRDAGVKCGRILEIKVIGYADDAALAEPTVEGMTERLKSIADASRDEADMEVSMQKTFSQHVHKRDALEVTEEEARAAESDYGHKCDFYPRKFKSQRNMLIHRANCIYNYNTTDEVFVIEDITGVFVYRGVRWFRLKYQGYEEEEWSRENLLIRDGCMDSIRNFWATSGLNPTKEFYADPEGAHRCTVCNKTFKRAQDLKTHRTRMKHWDENRSKITRTAVVDAVLSKRKQRATEDFAKSQVGQQRSRELLAFQIPGVNFRIRRGTNGRYT